MIKFPSRWELFLKDALKSEGYMEAVNYIRRRNFEGAIICPSIPNIFRSFTFGGSQDARVIFLGQEPYSGINEADGLAFSSIKLDKPVNLKILLKELHDDLGIERSSGDLTGWAQQGVLLLNMCLTVEQGQPCSHEGIGWSEFIELGLTRMGLEYPKKVFVLLGMKAREYESLIDTKKHIIIKGSYPSNLSSRSFYGSKLFSQINEALKIQGFNEIDWSL